MSSLSDLVPLPPHINPGLHACREQTMLDLFGKPGTLTDSCSPVTGSVKARMRYGVDIGPFKVSGLDYAVESLAQILQELSASSPEVYSALKTAGMLCVRKIKHNPSHFSNHSWGTAIDLYFGPEVVSQGTHATQRGFLSVYKTFNQYGWYWGAGFSGSSVDSMHFELADETMRGLSENPLSPMMLIADSEYIRDSGYDLVTEIV